MSENEKTFRCPGCQSQLVADDRGRVPLHKRSGFETPTGPRVMIDCEWEDMPAPTGALLTPADAPQAAPLPRLETRREIEFADFLRRTQSVLRRVRKLSTVSVQSVQSIVDDHIDEIDRMLAAHTLDTLRPAPQRLRDVQDRAVEADRALSVGRLGASRSVAR